MKKPWDASRWTYTIEERRNGYWEAVADDHQGTQLTRAGWALSDEETQALLEAVKQEAADLTERRRAAAGR